jgi:hypothetical protein
LPFVQASGPEPPLDIGLVVVGLGLGDPAHAVGVDGQQPEAGVVVHPGVPEQLGHLQHGDVVGAGLVAGGSGGAKPGAWWIACTRARGTWRSAASCS